MDENKNNNIDKKLDKTDEFSMSNYSAYDSSHNQNYTEEHGFDYEVKAVDNDHKKKGRKKFVSYIVVGILCSLIGGITSSAALLYVLPKTSLFTSTPLYKNLSQSVPYYNAASNSSAKSSTVSTGSSLTVAQIAKKVGPAVVGVSTKSYSASDFYGSSSSSEEGVGSGIIINNNGYILTNYHVISGAQTIKITFNNKKTASAKVVNYDSKLDLAIIKVDGSMTMPGVATLGSSSNLQVGDSVVAIGNPMGLEFLGSVTTGVVSALNREVQSETGNTQTLIQTDAAINPGNSGGPLVDSQGNVIGITSSKLTGGTEGMGFAIPIDVVKSKLGSLSKQMVMLGIEVTDVSSDDAQTYGVPQGVAVKNVSSSSSAAKAGIQSGDIITKFGSQTVKSADDLNTAKSNYNVGDKVPVTVYRNGSSKDLTITLSN